MNKIKLVLINHFSNPLVREMLDLEPEGKHVKYRDLGMWNTNLIEGLKHRDDIDLYVISPHTGMKKIEQEFVQEGVHYFFYRRELPYPWGRIESHLFSQSKRNFPRNRKIVKRIIQRIKPDIVNLIGAENAYYSITALDVENIPVIIHLQTVYANPDRIKNTGSADKKRWEVELKIFHKTPYMACNSQRYYDLIKQYEPNAIVFPRKWPVAEFPAIPEVEKKYDFVYFARFLNKNKGFDNAVEALGRFIKVHPNVKLLAVGRKDNDWAKIETRINELGLNDAIETHNSITDYRDMLQFVRQGRFALLPITMDIISGTILESIRMKMPVVTCRTCGTPTLNEKRETVLISEIGDSDGLCQNMLQLYENVDLQNKLIENGLLYLKEMDDENAHNVDTTVAQYKAVMEHYYHGVPIPQEMLFKENIMFI